ncbi:MAG: hypothetical protein IJX82_05015 [Clostridia bacterium]|nr:hypothetical protein [Clostridia bacterium]
MENRFDRLFSLEASVAAADLPVAFEAGALLKDRLSDNLYVQIKLRTASSIPIEKVVIVIVSFDKRSKCVGNAVEYEYTVSADETSCFGQKTLIPLENEGVCSFSVSLHRVCLVDGTQKEFTDVTLAIPQNVESRMRKREMLKRRIRASALAAVSFVATFLVVVYLVVPLVRYWQAKHLMSNDDFREAHRIFTELNDFADCPELRRECIVSEAQWRLDTGDFQGAFQWLVASTGIYGDAWSNFPPLTIKPELQKPLYIFLKEKIEANADFDYWDDSWFGTTHSKALSMLLESLPGAYEDVERLREFFGALTQTGTVHPVAEYVIEHRDLIDTLWEYSAVRDFATMDETILQYMEGYWYDVSGECYIRFYLNEDGGYYLQTFGLLTPDVGHSYYEVSDRTVVYLGANNERLCDAFRFAFDVENPRVVYVYCCANGETVTLTKR